MNIVTAAQMQKIDRITIEKFGLSAEVLMGFAGKHIADFLLNKFDKEKQFCIFCGCGNNGGDGFVIAYFLFNSGFNINIFLAGSKDKISDISKVYYELCINSGINIIQVSDVSSIDIDSYDIIIDALLGTGSQGEARGIVKDIITLINDSKSYVISVDLPSGLPADGDACKGIAVKADYTITIGLPKISLVTYPNKAYVGELHIADIGFPKELTESHEIKNSLIDIDYIHQKLRLTYDCDTHKWQKGHLLFIGGFDSMEGAIMMSASAAFETGIGLGTLLTTQKARAIAAGHIPELMTTTLNSFDLDKYADKPDTNAIESDIDKILEKKFDGIIIGPGMGRTNLAHVVFNIIINKIQQFKIKKVLIDGDGLYHLSDFLKNNTLPDTVEFILTPHFHEASRLLNITVDEIKSNRLKAAKQLSEKTKSITLLKGPCSIVTNNDNSLINTTGNQSMATAGSGDVLSGIIGSLMLKDISMLDAAAIGAYIHGLSGDIAITQEAYTDLKATDLIKYIRKAFFEIYLI